jgi:hypothetical protein
MPSFAGDGIGKQGRIGVFIGGQLTQFFDPYFLSLRGYKKLGKCDNLRSPGKTVYDVTAYYNRNVLRHRRIYQRKGEDVIILSGCQVGGLPVYAIWPECMYVSYIPGFSMESRPESRYLNWRCYGRDGL